MKTGNVLLIIAVIQGTIAILTQIKAILVSLVNSRKLDENTAITSTAAKAAVESSKLTKDIHAATNGQLTELVGTVKAIKQATDANAVIAQAAVKVLGEKIDKPKEQV